MGMKVRDVLSSGRAWCPVPSLALDLRVLLARLRTEQVFTGMNPTVVPASFRDRAGFVWTQGGAIYRHVGEEHREHYDRFMSSGLYDELTSEGMLVPHV